MSFSGSSMLIATNQLFGFKWLDVVNKMFWVTHYLVPTVILWQSKTLGLATHWHKHDIWIRGAVLVNRLIRTKMLIGINKGIVTYMSFESHMLFGANVIISAKIVLLRTCLLRPTCSLGPQGSLEPTSCLRPKSLIVSSGFVYAGNVIKNIRLLCGR